MTDPTCCRCANFRPDDGRLVPEAETLDNVRYGCESCRYYGPFICVHGKRAGYPLWGVLCDRYEEGDR